MGSSNLYCFSMFPYKHQPSGTCNMSKIDYSQIVMNLQSIVNVNNTVKFRCYAINENILRIVNGLCGIVFTS